MRERDREREREGERERERHGHAPRLFSVWPLSQHVLWNFVPIITHTKNAVNIVYYTYLNTYMFAFGRPDEFRRFLPVVLGPLPCVFLMMHTQVLGILERCATCAAAFTVELQMKLNHMVQSIESNLGRP